MNTGFEVLDYVVFALYAATILFIGLWVSRSKDGKERNAEDYFLASKSLPWWAIGASLIAANISAEQMIGMSGSGFALGIAIASYELMSAATLIIVAKFFIPIFIDKGIFTIPEFLEKRYSARVKSILAIFWIALFVFVNLTSVLFLGAKALDMVLGNGDGSLMIYSIVGLALFAAAYSLWGGLSAVAWTDVLQVVLLVAGGLITTYIALDNLTPEGGVLAGAKHMLDVAPEKFHLILEKGHPEYMNLPGIAVLVGGLWVANLYYWGFNQYIIQRTLAAKSLRESQKGIMFAGFLKLLIPFIVVIPGVIAYVMYTGPEGTTVIDGVKVAFTGEAGQVMNDNAYPWLVSTFIPTGLKGLVIAALAAAIVSSLASMLNSTSTIFTLDIYKPYIDPKANDKKTVNVGRITAAVALVIACAIAPMLGDLGQIFQFIQEYTGLVSPGILAIFMLGLFWKRTTTNAAIWGALLGIPVAFLLKIGTIDGLAQTGFGSIFPILPWMHQMMWTFFIVVAIMLVISHIEGKGKTDAKGIELNTKLFETSQSFNIGAVIALILTAAIYALFW
jgi:SSS family solute:Na+ symporter